MGLGAYGHRGVYAAALVAAGGLGCRDVSGFSTGADRYQGPVVQADFVRVGVGPDVEMCLSLDASQLQTAPGSLTTSDGAFQATPMRVIPQIWNDPLSTFNFGEGRIRNLLYVATAQPTDAGTAVGDTFAVVSLMSSGDVEVRLVAGAPSVGDAAPLPAGTPPNVFALFELTRQSGGCPF